LKPAVLLLCLLARSLGGEACPEYVLEWGGLEVFPQSPRSVGVDPLGRVHVVADDQIYVFDEFGSPLGQRALFTYPNNVTDIAVDLDGETYVASLADNVQVFDAAGELRGSIGSTGSGDGQFQTPTGVAVGPDGVIYVSDLMNHRIQAFAPNRSFLRKWGSQGKGAGQFGVNGPRDVEVDHLGNVYVGDSDGTRWRIQVFTGEGQFLRTLTPPDCPSGGSAGLFGLATDPAGDLYAVRHSFSPAAACVQKLDAQGNVLCAWGNPGTAGHGEFSGPQDVVVDARGNVYVVESLGRRVQKFRVGGVAVRPATWSEIKAGTGLY
jgi:DNA-binding beta-propeller fold protein YncE